MKYLITGGNGFLGRYLHQFLKKRSKNFLSTVRQNPGENQIETGDLNSYSDWTNLFEGIDVVVHTAAKAHDMTKTADLKKIYQSTNFDLTLVLATAAKENRVRKFIFISTIKVNGEFTTGVPFKADDKPNPTDEYGVSKQKAEEALLQLHEPGVFDVVILRPCLIYGRETKGNFANLIKIIRKKIPLPFGSVNNLRSFVSLENLADLIVTVAESPKASGHIFLVSDDDDLSFTELIKKIAKASGSKATLIPVPVAILNFFFKLIGRQDLSIRLFSNLQVDITKTKELLDWRPPISTTEGLSQMFSEQKKI